MMKHAPHVRNMVLQGDDIQQFYLSAIACMLVAYGYADRLINGEVLCRRQG